MGQWQKGSGERTGLDDITREDRRRGPKGLSRSVGLALLAFVIVLSVAGGAAYARVVGTLQHVSRAQDVRRNTAEVTSGAAASAAPQAASDNDHQDGDINRTPDMALSTQPTPIPTVVAPHEGTAQSPPDLVKHPFTVLVIGIDLRPDPADTSVRSDTLMLLRVDPVAHHVSMLSIPRDTLVSIPRAFCGGTHKINAAYACGYLHPTIYGPEVAPTDAGAALAAETVERLLHVPVDYTAQVDFAGFVEVVDALGGISVDVPDTIVDPAYPTDDYRTKRLVIKAGPQHMDGEQALEYARTRHADSDFGRARRQQQVLLAVLEQLKQQGLWKQLGSSAELVDIFGRSVQTTLPLTDLQTVRALAELARDVRADRVTRLVLQPERNPDGSSNLRVMADSAIKWDARYVRRVVEQFQGQLVADQVPAGGE